MEFNPPQPIELTAKEQALWDQIRQADAQAHPHSNWAPVGNAMQALMASLLERDAIPEIRIDLFTESGLAEKGARSRLEVFEGNGTKGRAIFRHGNFPPYLKHFIEGPGLPRPVIEGLCKILNDDAGTSGMLMDQWRGHARASIRRFGLDRHKAATEFFRLAVEIGMDEDDARTLRQAAMSTR